MPAPYTLQFIANAQERIKKVLSDTKVTPDVRKLLMESFDDLHRAQVCINMEKERTNEAQST